MKKEKAKRSWMVFSQTKDQTYGPFDSLSDAKKMVKGLVPFYDWFPDDETPTRIFIYEIDPDTEEILVSSVGEPQEFDHRKTEMFRAAEKLDG